MLRLALVAAAALMLVPWTPAALACNGTIIEIIIEDGSPDGLGVYSDNRIDGPENVKDIWLYMENNLIDGLQSGGANEVLGKGFPWPVWYDPCFTLPYGPRDLPLFV